MRRRWIIALIILLLLAILFEFDPFHPIDWWHHTVALFHAGEEDAVRDKAHHQFRIHFGHSAPADSQTRSAAPAR